ncbi:unnamed protein product [Vitrella brassicaformis CCMP3155]|uniref:Uncharacterized protein n=1 Tax=Vitrella brassicaformis (strain CCMP3155) TaxID=1169540 RepID=A0A0G4F699_VITBC|nr:unnamed protein product [Vitrella brassicaformis CCMP3155]|eukprot:CEM07774.1 unnamed protein product [Vitrella brassicaformis CCMP3155]
MSSSALYLCLTRLEESVLKMSTAARDGPLTSSKASSAASAASGASNASCANQQQQQHDRLLSAADVPEEAVPTVAEHVRSYSQLEALIDAHPTLRTSALLLPILIRLLPVVVESSFGALVEMPIPQLALDVAAAVAPSHRNALSRFLLPLLLRVLGVLLPIAGLGSFLMRVIPRLPLPAALSHGCRMAVAIEQLSRRLRMLERGGDWARWRPHLEMLYHIRGKRPVVLGDEHFDAFGSREAFIGETEAVRQWRILSGAITVHHRGQQRQLMYGNNGLHGWSYGPPALLAAPSRLFPQDTLDAADPPTFFEGNVYANYTSVVAFVLIDWLRYGEHSRITLIRSLSSYCRDSPASRRVCELLAAPPSDAAQWGAGAAVFDRKWQVWVRPWHERLVVLGSEVMGEGLMALVRLTDSGLHSVHVDIFTNEPTVAHDQGGYVSIWSTDSPRIPYTSTHSAVMSVLGDHLGGMVWRKEQQR